VEDPNLPIPAIASAGFLQSTGLRPGGEAELAMGSVIMPVTIQGQVSLFPTLDESGGGFLIVNQEHLYYFASLTNQANAASRPNEVWLALSDNGELRDAALDDLRYTYGIAPVQTIDSADLIADLGSDPVTQASGSGILLIALVAAFSILALGFALTLYLGGQSRTIEVAVMRAVGISPRQIFIMIGFEYLLIAALGLAIGTIAGLRISETMLSFLNVTEDGNAIVPSFRLVTRWDTVLIAFIATAAAFLAGIVALAFYFLRLHVSRVLRLTR
jgi:ABC-type antimicrobial peptide transport system permease subunit